MLVSRSDVKRILFEIVEDAVVFLHRRLVHAVDVHGLEGMVLVDGDVDRVAVLAAGAGVDDARPWAQLGEGGQETELARAVALQVLEGVVQRADVAYARREVENDLLVDDVA